MKNTEKVAETWLLKITYSWGEEEPDIKVYGTFEQAWQKAKQMAADEAEISSLEWETEIGLRFEKKPEVEEGKITLHYTYDESYCWYKINKAIKE